MTHRDLMAEGERRRDAGTALAADRRPLRTAQGELAMLDMLLTEPGATVTTDLIADDPADAYADGGRWVGSVALRLLRAGIMVEVGTVRSCRPSRHRGRTGLYALADRDAAERRRAELRKLLTTAPAAPVQRAL